MGRAARNKDTGLTDKEEAFCQYVVNHIEASDSDAYRAVYNCEKMKPETVNKRANELKHKGHITARIDLLRKERSERTKIDSDYVITTIVETIERCKQARPVLNPDGSHRMVETEDGELAPAYVFDSKAVLKGAELLGRNLNMFTDKVQVEVVDHASVLDKAHKRLKAKRDK